MPDIDLEPDKYRTAGEPRKSWWARLNQKPADWDKPAKRTGRIIAAVIMGLGLLWVRSRH